MARTGAPARRALKPAAVTPIRKHPREHTSAGNFSLLVTSIRHPRNAPL
jgi:hypothetical protein